MITIFDLIAILLPIAGLSAGISIGKDYGVGWAIMGAAVGLFAGFGLGRLPTVLLVKHEKEKLRKLTVNELKQQLYKPVFSDGYTPNFLLLELRSRGEDLTQHVQVVLNLMEHDSCLIRGVGFSAMLSAYPQYLKRMRRYSPSWQTEQCKLWVAELRCLLKEGS